MASGIQGAVAVAASGPDSRLSADSLLQAAFLAGDNPVFLVSIESRTILACNAATERVFGYRPDELLGCDTERLHVDSKLFRDFGAQSEKVLYDGVGSYHCHYWMRRRDGSTFPSEHLVQLINGDDGYPVAVVSIVRDVSEASDSPSMSVRGDVRTGSFRALADNLPGIVYQWVRTMDGQDRFTFLAGGLFQRYGVDPETVRTNSSLFFSGLFTRDRWELEEEIARSRAMLSPIDMEVRYRAPNDETVWLRVLSQPRRLDDGSVAWDGFALDVSQEKLAEERLHHLATHDQITGLPNRFQVMTHVSRRITRASYWGRRFAVAVVDIHRMTRINETYGFEQGDRVLRLVAERLNGEAFRREVVGRGHGDGFLLVLSDATDEAALSRALQRLRSVFDTPFTLADETTVQVGARIGLAIYPDDATSADALLHAAHVAMETARRTPGPEYAFYAEELGAQLRHRARREEALRAAIQAGELTPYFQPQVSLENRSLVGLEALVRWVQPDGKVLPPAEFIPLAEESGLIIPLGKLVLRKVITCIRTWLDAGLDVPPVSVNCSARQFRGTAFEDDIREQLQAAALPPELLMIEITESSLMDDPEAAQRTMSALTAIGVRFSIDDFGTGFSSLGSLAELPFHTLKIDRSFVASIGTDDRRRVITELLIRMSDALGLMVIAEGVETSAQEARLRRLGCMAAQGYLYARPLPASGIRQWLPKVRAEG